MQISSLYTGQWLRTAFLVSGLLGFSAGHPIQIKATKMMRHHRHSPMLLHGERDATTSESYNWSGYAVTGPNGSVSLVLSSWVVPSVGTCSAVPEGYAAFWTGIDGWSSTTVEQIGTDSDCVNLTGTKTGAPTYYAWFEFYPQNAYLIGNYSSAGTCISGCVSPGDKMVAEVVAGSAGTAGGTHGPGGPSFAVIIFDLTKGWEFSTSSSVPSAKQSSAEWIAETPYGCATSSGFCPLSDFGTADYGLQYTGENETAYATVSGTTQPIGSFGSSVHNAIMVNYPNGTTVMAEPSALTDNGTSFSDTWSNAGP